MPFILGADTVNSTDLVRRRWLDNMLLGPHGPGRDRASTNCTAFRRRRTWGSWSGDLDVTSGAEPDHEYYRSVGQKLDLSGLPNGQ